MFHEVDELSLLVWLSRGNKKTLIKLMCEYTGCKPEVYTNSEIIHLFELALSDISRKYHIKILVYEYFHARSNWKAYTFFYPKNYTEADAEIDALGSAIFSIKPKVFDEKDSNTIKELKKDYLDKMDTKED